MIDIKTAEKYIDNHVAKRQKWFENQAYYLGKHPPINSTPVKPAPDYRVSVPLLRVAVDQLAGYVVKPGSVQYEGDAYENVLKPIYDDNEEPLITQQEFKAACTHGEAWEFHWMQDKKFYFAMLPGSEVVPVYTNDLKPKLLAIIWYRWIDNKLNAMIVDDTSRMDYIKDKGWELVLEEKHGFRAVPAVKFQINYDGSNLFDHVKEMVDANDRLYSHDVANELEKYANAILLLRDRLKQEDKDDIKYLGMFEGLGENVTNAVAYLTKDIKTEFIEFAANNLRDMIYECLQIPNMHNRDKGQATSGYAKMLDNMTFEFLCASIEGAFIRGLQDRVRLICGHVLVNVDGTEVSIKMHRNMPFDLETYAKVAAQLTGTYDLEAILDIFPDYILSKEAKQRILAAKEANAQMMLETLATPAIDVEDDNDQDNVE